MIATKKVAEYVNKMGISIKAICENTGLSKNVLYTSLGSGEIGNSGQMSFYLSAYF